MNYSGVKYVLGDTNNLMNYSSKSKSSFTRPSSLFDEESNSNRGKVIKNKEKSLDGHFKWWISILIIMNLIIFILIYIYNKIMTKLDEIKEDLNNN